MSVNGVALLFINNILKPRGVVAKWTEFWLHPVDDFNKCIMCRSDGRRGSLCSFHSALSN